MFVAGAISGDCEFEYHGNELTLFVTVVDAIADVEMQIGLSEFVIQSLHEGVVHALDLILTNAVDKEMMFQGKLENGASVVERAI